MNNILVTGGTGTLGKEVVEQLAYQKRDVSVLSSRKAPLLPSEITLYRGDLATGSGLHKATENAKIIIHCASNPKAPWHVDVKGTENLIKAAKKNQVQHFIYISIVGIDKSHYAYYSAKSEAEKLIKKSGIPWSILRTTQFHNLVFSLIQSFKKENSSSIVVPEGLQFQSIDISEVASQLVKLAKEGPKGRLPDTGGPQILNIVKMMRIYLKTFDKGHINIKSKPIEGELYDIFRTGFNLCPGNSYGNITWKKFCSGRRKNSSQT